MAGSLTKLEFNYEAFDAIRKSPEVKDKLRAWGEQNDWRKPVIMTSNIPNTTARIDLGLRLGLKLKGAYNGGRR